MKTLSIVRTRPLRLYLDTSVYGGYFDEEFKEDTRKLFDEILMEKHILILSDTVLREIAKAPKIVQDFVSNLPMSIIENVMLNEEIQNLRQDYIMAGVLTDKQRDDAEHIATASVKRVDIIISWNFKHIVHYDKIHGFNEVNRIAGYPVITIHSPKEVIHYEKEEEI